MAKEASAKLAVLADDGVGPEITEATVMVLEAAASQAEFLLRLSHGDVGWNVFESTGSTLPAQTPEIIDTHPAWIVEPTFAGEYPKDDPARRHPTGLLRRRFKLFANVRPVEALPQFNPLVPGRSITVLRENTESFYPDRNLVWRYSEFKPTDNIALSLRS